MARKRSFVLAVIAFEMLAGQGPFVGDSVGTVLSRVLYEDPPPMGIDPAIERVVQLGPGQGAGGPVSVDRRLRAGTPASLRADLGHAAPGPVRNDADMPDLLDDQLHRRRRWPWAVAAAAAGMVGVFGGGGPRRLWPASPFVNHCPLG